MSRTNGECVHQAILGLMSHDEDLHRVVGVCETCGYEGPCRCVCGYEACCGVGADAHIIAMGTDAHHYWK